MKSRHFSSSKWTRFSSSVLAATLIWTSPGFMAYQAAAQQLTGPEAQVVRGAGAAGAVSGLRSSGLTWAGPGGVGGSALSVGTSLGGTVGMVKLSQMSVPGNPTTIGVTFRTAVGTPSAQIGSGPRGTQAHRLASQGWQDLSSHISAVGSAAIPNLSRIGTLRSSGRNIEAGSAKLGTAALSGGSKLAGRAAVQSALEGLNKVAVSGRALAGERQQGVMSAFLGGRRAFDRDGMGAGQDFVSLDGEGGGSGSGVSRQAAQTPPQTSIPDGWVREIKKRLKEARIQGAEVKAYLDVPAALTVRWGLPNVISVMIPRVNNRRQPGEEFRRLGQIYDILEKLSREDLYQDLSGRTWEIGIKPVGVDGIGHEKVYRTGIPIEGKALTQDEAREFVYDVPKIRPPYNLIATYSPAPGVPPFPDALIYDKMPIGEAQSVVVESYGENGYTLYDRSITSRPARSLENYYFLWTGPVAQILRSGEIQSDTSGNASTSQASSGGKPLGALPPATLERWRQGILRALASEGISKATVSFLHDAPRDLLGGQNVVVVSIPNPSESPASEARRVYHVLNRIKNTRPMVGLPATWEIEIKDGEASLEIYRTGNPTKGEPLQHAQARKILRGLPKDAALTAYTPITPPQAPFEGAQIFQRIPTKGLDLSSWRMYRRYAEADQKDPGNFYLEWSGMIPFSVDNPGSSGSLSGTDRKKQGGQALDAIILLGAPTALAVVVIHWMFPAFPMLALSVGAFLGVYGGMSIHSKLLDILLEMRQAGKKPPPLLELLDNDLVSFILFGAIGAFLGGLAMVGLGRLLPFMTQGLSWIAAAAVVYVIVSGIFGLLALAAYLLSGQAFRG